MPSVRQRKFARASILLHNMRHEAQVALDQHVPGIQIPLCRFVQIIAFFLLRQGFGERAGLKLQGVQQCAEHQPHSGQHAHHLRCKLIRHSLSSFLWENSTQNNGLSQYAEIYQKNTSLHPLYVTCPQAELAQPTEYRQDY